MKKETKILMRYGITDRYANYLLNDERKVSKKLGMLIACDFGVPPRFVIGLSGKNLIRFFKEHIQ